MLEEKPLSELIAESFNQRNLEALKFKAMAEIGFVPTWIASSDGKLLYINNAFTKLTGFTLEELQENEKAAHYPEDHERIIKSWGKYVNDPDAENYIWEEHGRIVRKDNYPIRCLMRGKRISNNGLVGSTVPVTIAPDLLVFDSPLEQFRMVFLLKLVKIGMMILDMETKLLIILIKSLFIQKI